jgi:hypothetical protein
MGRLGDWDKVERKKRPISYTKQDELWDYFKMFLIFVAGYLYLHYVIMGWHF